MKMPLSVYIVYRMHLISLSLHYQINDDARRCCSTFTLWILLAMECSLWVLVFMLLSLCGTQIAHDGDALEHDPIKFVRQFLFLCWKIVCERDGAHETRVAHLIPRRKRSLYLSSCFLFVGVICSFAHMLFHCAYVYTYKSLGTHQTL